ncbi:MAG: AfsR/SARP family transcriptional regulator [Pseudonocardiaceae bacterium]
MFPARVMRPLPTATRLTNPSVQRIAEAPLSLVRGPPGSYVAERLAAAIQGWDRWQGCVWLRAGGARPAALAESLVRACLHRWTDDHRDDPAPVSNARLDETMRRSPAGAVVVLELDLDRWITPGLARLLDGIKRVAADRGISLVVVIESRSPAVFLRSSDCVISTAALSEPSRPVEAAELTSRCAHRLRTLSGRRAAVRHDVLDAIRAWPAEAIADAVDTSGTVQSMLDRLTANLLDLSSPAQLGALQTCAATGYWHPQLATGAVQASELRPWVVPLEGEWGWLRPIWTRSLQRHLTGRTGHRHRSRPEDRIAKAPAAEPTAPRRGIIEARLLGTFELRVDGRAVEKWTGQRGTSVLRYLLSRRRHTCSRDELLEAFWPEVAPGAARNRLQVAVSGLRRALCGVTNLHVIEYAEGGYRINPELRVDVDVERFEAALSMARSAERSGDLDGALIAYREALELYRGDFVSDAPYEQWTLLPRETLRLTYIDALDRVSRIQLSAGRLDDCIAVGLRMLDVDPCREDAHRLLMRCYASRGQAYQATRQYEFCCRILKRILEVEPAPETTRLYRAIGAGSAAEPAPTG